MERSLYMELVKTHFPVIVKNTVPTINGEKKELVYHFKSMLNEVYSIDLKWASLSAVNSIVAADVVEMDSALPLKKRDSLKKAEGDIPKLGMKMYLTEKAMTEIDLLKLQKNKISQMIPKLFADTKKCIVGVEERIEFMFLQGLSTGVTSLHDENNVGKAIRLKFNIPNKNKFGVKLPWTNPDALILDDIERVITGADLVGDVPAHMLLDKQTFNAMRRNKQIREAHASSLGIVVLNNSKPPVPTKEALKNLIEDETGLKITVIDRRVEIEINGKKKKFQPWERGMVTFVSSLKVGSLYYGTLAEENRPVKNVVYEKATKYTLVSKYSKNDPLREFTSSQAFVVPVLENTDSIYSLDTNEYQTVAASEVEGDATIEIWNNEYNKAEVITALGTLDIQVSANITDAELIGRINELSVADETALKDLLE